MYKNWEKQNVRFSTTPINLDKRTNEKSRKTDGSINDESVQKRTSLNGNGMYMRNRLDAMTSNPKELRLVPQLMVVPVRKDIMSSRGGNPL